MSTPSPQTVAPRTWSRRLALPCIVMALGGGGVAHHAFAVMPPDRGAATARLLEEQEPSDQLIVKYRKSSAVSPLQFLAAGHPVNQSLNARGVAALSARRNAQGAQVLRLSRTLPAAELRELAARVAHDDPNVLFAEPDYRMQIQGAMSDPMYVSQWDLFETTGGMRVPEAWALSNGAGVVVAVVDTGFRPHADLAANLLSGYDFVSNPSMANDGDGRDSDASDPGDGCTSGHSSWHGTHVSGTIAAVNNGAGIAGIAFNAKILPVRVLGCGGGYNSDIADGLMWASGAPVAGVDAPPQPARVINLSLGGAGPCSATMLGAINAARAAGAVVVVAAGNSNTLTSGFSPANCPGVITVAANGRGGGRAPYSNYGAEVDVTAPGGNTATGTANGILSTLNSGSTSPGDDSYAYYQGTSMAAPHAAAAAALMISRNPDLTPDEVEVLLRSTTRALPIACTTCGTGIVNAGAAVKAVYLGASPPTVIGEMEPNDALTQGQMIDSVPSKVAGTISTAADLDTYKIGVPAGSTLTARLIGNMSSDYNLGLRNAVGTVIASSTRGRGLTDTIAWKNTTGKAVNMLVRVSRLSGGVGDTAGRYWLEFNR